MSPTEHSRGTRTSGLTRSFRAVALELENFSKSDSRGSSTLPDPTLKARNPVTSANRAIDARLEQ